MADQENHQAHDNSYQNPHAQQNLDASQLNNNYMNPHDPAMYAQGYDPAQQEMMLIGNDSMESGNNYEPMDNFPIEALAPFNQGLAAFAGEVEDNRGQKLKEARLMEALERQTSLLDSIAQSYQKNRDLRHKADLRKLKNRLEKLENEKLFRELETQQIQSANDIAQQNNQLIFSHLNAQAQLKANPIVLNMGNSPSGIPPFALHASLPPIGGFPGMFPGQFSMPPRGFPFGPGPQWGAPPMGSPMMRAPPGFGPPPMGPRSGQMPMGGGIGFNKGPPVRLPPIKDSRKGRGDSDSDSDDDRRVRTSKKKGKKDVDNYLSQVFDKYKRK